MLVKFGKIRNFIPVVIAVTQKHAAVVQKLHTVQNIADLNDGMTAVCLCINGYNTVFLWTGIPVLILAIVVAVFTASHMEEVVDLRMFFTNSDAELFEVTISYTFDRFVATLHSGALLALCCEVIWYLCQSTEPINTLF